MYRSLFSWPQHKLEVRSASDFCCFTPGERAPATHWIGGWVGPTAGLDEVKIFDPTRTQIVSCPACRQLLY
jgi:hypothetical protein